LGGAAGKNDGSGAAGLSAAPVPVVQDQLNEDLKKLAGNVFDTFWRNGQDLPSRLLASHMPLLRKSSDYAGIAASTVEAVAYMLLRLVEYRMDVTVGHDYTGGYLFKDTERTAYYGRTAGDKRDQFEKALQLDCMHRLHVFFGQAAKIEPSDIASGRADIAIETNGIRFSIEVKHEESDASHVALVRKYGGQSTEYFNTNIRVGFLFVLDRSRADGTAGHLRDKFSVHEVRKDGEAEPRLLIVMTMPGKRKRPSGLGPVEGQVGTVSEMQPAPPAIPPIQPAVGRRRRAGRAPAT
jgi:hypothetical protein